jgi:hypothetical protein
VGKELLEVNETSYHGKEEFLVLGRWPWNGVLKAFGMSRCTDLRKEEKKEFAKANGWSAGDIYGYILRFSHVGGQ